MAHLTREFYRWERRARGWRLWDYAVDIEPLFERLVLPIDGRAGDDDGRRDTTLSRLFRQDRPLAGSTAPVASQEPQGRPHEADHRWAELQLLVPSSLTVAPAVVAQMLQAMGPETLMSFELVATGGASLVQLACPEEQVHPVESQLRAYMPQIGLVRPERSLADAWNADGTSCVVEFGLESEFFLPLSTASSFDVDPLSAAVAALDGVSKAEVAVLQVLFRPNRDQWASEAAQALTLGLDGDVFFIDAPELVKLAAEKLCRTLFSVVVRIGALADSEERAWGIARRIGGALGALRRAQSNALMPLENDGYPEDVHVDDLVSRRSRRTGMLLNLDELVTIVHPPSASVVSDHLSRLVRKTKSAGAAGKGTELILGSNQHQGETRRVGLSTSDRLRHTYVIGASGTGKSTLLLNLIAQDLRAGAGFALLDPHGDLIEQVIERIPDERLDDVVLFDASDEAYPVGLNILNARSEAEKTLLASDLVEAFRRLSSSWGDQMTSVLANAILAFLESPRGGTLAELRRFLVEPDYRDEQLKTVQDPEIVYYWRKEFGMLTGRPQAPLLTRLDTFLRPKLIRAMVSQKHDRLDFRRMMDSRKIFLAKLTQGAIGEENSYLLGTLLVTKLHQAALGRQSLPESQRAPFFLYIDEFHNFVTPSIASILSGARKFGLGLVLSHQELHQVSGQNADVASAVIANPFARICFRLGDDDARKLRSGFSFFDEKDLQNLGVGEAIVRLGRSEHDLNLKADSPTAPLPDPAARRERILARSRERYARPREDASAGASPHQRDQPAQAPPRKFGPPRVE